MTVFDAYAIADPAIDWKSEVAARIGDILQRRIHEAGATGRPVRERVERLVRLVESGIARARPVHLVKDSIAAVLESLRARGATLDGEVVDAASIARLDALHERIRRHGEGREIGSYESYLFCVDVRVSF